MRADKVMVFVIMAVIIIVGYLLWLNRGSEKIFDALLVILTTTLVTGLGSLLVILRPAHLAEEFVTVFIYDSKEDYPLLVQSYPIRKRLGIDSALWSKPRGNQGQQHGNAVPEKSNVNERLLDFLMRSMVERIFEQFHNAWSIEAKTWSVPGADQYSWGPSQDAERLPKIELLKDNLLEGMASEGNVFASSRAETGGLFSKVALPPGTDVSYHARDGKRELLLSNSFVQLRITAHFNSMGVLQHEYYDVFQLDQHDRNRYRQVSFSVKATADFSSWRAGWEMMTHQKRWAESVIMLLREKFDWAPVAEEIKVAWMTKQLEKL